MSDGFRLARPGAIGRGRKSSEIDESVPQAIWDALNIARENKALFVAKGGAIVNVNELAAQLCDRTPEELLGGRFISQFLQFSQTRQPAATMRRWETELTTASGVQIPVEVTYEPLRTDLHELEVYAIRDLRERRRAAAQIEDFNGRLQQQHDLLKVQEQQLRAQNVQLDAALNNIAQGLAMFDADQRLVLCNRRYAEIYELSPDQVTLGTTLLEIIRHRVGNKLLSDMSPEAIVDAMLRKRNGTHFGEFYSQLSDGRCIAITVQPMADGGTVTTHQDITEQRRSEAKISHMALHDALTGLPNRALLNEHLEHALARVKRGEIVATHLLDLDYFKNVNDTLGHPVGDKLLKMVAERLRALLRDADMIARMGGDEFAIVQLGIALPSDATSLAQRVIEVVGEPYDMMAIR